MNYQDVVMQDRPIPVHTTNAWLTIPGHDATYYSQYPVRLKTAIAAHKLLERLEHDRAILNHRYHYNRYGRINYAAYALLYPTATPTPSLVTA